MEKGENAQELLHSGTLGSIGETVIDRLGGPWVTEPRVQKSKKSKSLICFVVSFKEQIEYNKKFFNVADVRFFD